MGGGRRPRRGRAQTDRTVRCDPTPKTTPCTLLPNLVEVAGGLSGFGGQRWGRARGVRVCGASSCRTLDECWAAVLRVGTVFLHIRKRRAVCEKHLMNCRHYKHYMSSKSNTRANDDTSSLTNSVVERSATPLSIHSVPASPQPSFGFFVAPSRRRPYQSNTKGNHRLAVVVAVLTLPKRRRRRKVQRRQ